MIAISVSLRMDRAATGFTLTESINVKLQSKTSGVSLIYTLNYEKAVRNSNTISAYDGTTTFTADENGAVGLALPED